LSGQDTTGAGSTSAGATWLAAPEGSGGFRLVRDGAQALWTVTAGEAGWSALDAEGEIWSLDRTGSAGFVVRGAAGEERARTMPLVGADGAGTRFLLLDDARLFRIVRRPPRDDGFALEGWEVPGAYALARPAPQPGWRLSLEPAGEGLAGAALLLLVLAAEALDADGRLAAEGR
jgi:hypothetical protein